MAGVAVDADILAQSRPLAWWTGNRRKKPPHIEFANATTDAKLAKFVKKWGPFDGSPRVWLVEATFGGLRHVPGRGKELVIRQNLRKLQVEQKFFSAAARLIAEIQSKKPDAERVFKYHAELPYLAKITRKQFFNTARSLYPGQPVASAVGQLAEYRVCGLLDRFPPMLFPTTAGPVELPPMDSGSIGKGIKHVLYGFLRLEYLRKERLGLGVCRRCGDVFSRERRGAVYCDESCSHQYRSLEYYQARGRARRQEKAAASKSRSLDLAPSKRTRT